MLESRQNYNNIISALWHSDVHDFIPTEMTNEFQAECRSLKDLEEAFLSTLPEERKKEYRILIDQQTAVTSIECEQAFIKGYKTALNLLFHGLH